MAKFTTLFLITLLCSTLVFASRPQPTFTEMNPSKTQHEGVETEHAASEAVEESCGGIAEEECLMRRTLAAHLDYIYTQNHKP